MRFYTANDAGTNTERMRIDSAGDVGIGITDPLLKLHVQDGAVSSATTPNTNCDACIEGTTSTGIQFLADSQIQLRFGSSGSTGDASIIYEHTNDIFRINYSNSGYLSFRDGSGETFRFTPNNEIGVAGANYGTSGQVLTSGGSGAAVSWADAAGGGATPTVKTANYTAASGDLVVVNGSGLTITLPSSPSVADSVEIRILGSRYCTVARNGQNIESTASNFYIDTFDGHTKFIYTDSTRGWLVA